MTEQGYNQVLVAVQGAMSGPLTMGSREIGDLVEVRHDSVKRTIERLAERGVIQLPPLVEVKNHLGQTVEEYRVEKRDSYVVVAQLSPEFTARLVDRWQELESRPMARPVKAITRDVDREARLCLKTFLSFGKLIGLTGNQLAISASRATKAATGFDPLEAMGSPVLIAPAQEALIIPTEIGSRMGGVSNRAVNELLVVRDYQTRHYDHKNKVYYELTEKGREAGGVMCDTERRHANGTPVQQIKWPSSIVERLLSEVH